MLTCAWSEDGSKVAVGGRDDAARIWDATTGECLRKLEGHNHWINVCSWFDCGRRLATASPDRTCRVWDTATGQCLQVLAGHTSSVESCAAADGLVVTCSHTAVRVWDASTGECLRVLRGHTETVRLITLRFSSVLLHLHHAKGW